MQWEKNMYNILLSIIYIIYLIILYIYNKIYAYSIWYNIFSHSIAYLFTYLISTFWIWWVYLKGIYQLFFFYIQAFSKQKYLPSTIFHIFLLWFLLEKHKFDLALTYWFLFNLGEIPFKVTVWVNDQYAFISKCAYRYYNIMC